jgi:VIT1/CCC1 family predicted Fe2+/Mn2+ transporter
MKGWRFSIWAKGLTEFRRWIGSVKNTLKTLLVAGAGVALIYFEPWATTTWGAVLAGVVAAGLTKLVADSADYWLSRIALPPE